MDDIELQDALGLARANNEDSISTVHDDRDLQWVNDIDTVDIKSIAESILQTDETYDSNDCDSPLHPYTDMLINSFCFRLIKSFRHSKLSQSESHILFDLIHSALPSPNNLPKYLMRLVFAPSCATSNEYDIATIYDSDVKSILRVLLENIGDKIRVYKHDLMSNNDTSGNLDIGFAYAYQNLLHRFSNEYFIMALIHLDGIGLCKSNKLKMWLLSFSIIELPAKLRYQKHNVVIVSIWVSSKEPIASVWLRKSIKKLEELTITGIYLNSLIALNFYLTGRQNDNDNFIEVVSYTSSRQECRRIWQKKEEGFDDNNGCEVEEEDENENDGEAIDTLTYCSILRGGTSSDEEADESHLNVSSASSIIQHLDVKIEKRNHANDIDISAYHEPGTSQIQEDMHKDINLLLIREKSVGDYTRQVLRSLYSREELTSSILPPGGEHFARKPLDNQRFEKLHRALRYKYYTIESRYDDFFHKNFKQCDMPENRDKVANFTFTNNGIDQFSFETEGAHFKAIHTPDNTTDHLCFWVEEEQTLFPGDTILGQGTTEFEYL
ncbi:unnamed protein product [Rotaria magnacalcarata]|uniref:Uncharacterized protein n=2 Tax=Rotaria magnacalcarata TaxID=392030 RepID=A0A816S251_9BILA|nr:unnamed protein product [Rotaria magnacalcarata]